MIAADQAMDRLVAGNQRFSNGSPRSDYPAPRFGSAIADAQSPFAVVVGCSDSRVPPELVFDQGPGELFVIRTAGHVLDRVELASVEFAVESLGVRLALVLGHEGCGAVAATLDTLRDPGMIPPGHLGVVVERIRPAFEPFSHDVADHEPTELVRAAIRRHVQRSIDHLREESPVLAQRIEDDRLLVVGGVYSIATGQVTYL